MRILACKLFLVMYSIVCISYLEGMDNSNVSTITVLKKDQLQKLHGLFTSVPDDSIANLYHWTGAPRLLEIPKEIILGSQENIKKLFEKNKFVPSNMFWEPKSWNEQNWQDVSECLIKRANKQSENIYDELAEKLHLDKIPSLLQDTKSVLKSFLPSDGSDLPEQDFIVKTGAFSRLLVYAKLQQAIERKKLSHVHLPLKLLVVKNEKTGKYVTNNSMIASILDEGVKVQVRFPFKLESQLYFDSSDYQLLVFAHRQEKKKVALSSAALADLNELTKEVPFDVGYDNIFSDSNGDAIIIDTEYKGEEGELSVAKLKRYEGKVI